MNLDEAVPDHRVELLQKWMADPKLMAQAGLLGSNSAAGNEVGGHLGVMKGALQRMGVHDARINHSSSTNTSHEAGHTHTKKKNKEAKKTVQVNLNGSQLKRLLEPAHGKRKHKKQHNPYLHNAESAADLDVKIGTSLAEYTQLIEHCLSAIVKVNANPRLSTLISESLQVIRGLASSKQNTIKAYADLANGIYNFVNDPPAPWKSYRRSFGLPTLKLFRTGSAHRLTMNKGYFTHSVMHMIIDFIQKNKKSVTPEVIGEVKTLKEHMKLLDKSFKEIKHLKAAQKAKVITEKESGVNHSSLRFLGEDEEALVQHDSAFHMGQPFEDY